MAKRFLKESEFYDALFCSSDEDDPSGDVVETDVVHDNLHDAQSWQEDEAEDLQMALEVKEENEEILPDLGTSHAVFRVHGRSRLLPGPSVVAPGAPLLSVVPLAASTATTSAPPVPTTGIPAPPSGAPQKHLQTFTVPPSAYPAPPSATPSASPVSPSASLVLPSASPAASPAVPSASPVAPPASPAPPSRRPRHQAASLASTVMPTAPTAAPSVSPAPPSASPAPPAASPDQNISPLEMKSRKRRRGPLCSAEGVALKQLSDAVYRAKDNTKWHSVPNPSLPPILTVEDFETAGPTIAVYGCHTPSETFSKFMTDTLLAEIVVHTNDKIIALRSRYKRQSDPTFKDLGLMEFRAFLSILIMAGARKDNHLTTEEMFSRSQGCPFYRSVMSEGRFCFIQRALRFDSSATREKRVKEDRFAAIRSVWDQVIAKCIENYEPGGHLTVDEQLLAFRGRCGFRMYIPNKPAKYGIKLVMACDAETFYMCNAIPYLGKGSVPTTTPHGEFYTMSLTLPFRKNGRTVTTDNWFTSFPLAKGLLQHGMYLVGTIRPKPCMPPVLLKTPLELGECVAAYQYQDKITLLCQRVKEKKRIQILSTVHHNPTIIEKKKSHIHMFYNATKGGVDTFDQICSALTCSRKTRRWPVCVFYGILNIVVNNSFYIHQNLPGNTTYNRRQYSVQLAMELGRNWALHRLANRRYLPREATSLICSVFEVQEPVDDQQGTSKRSEKRKRCPFCPSASNTRTKLICEKCQRSVCAAHVSYLCEECMKAW